MSACQCGCGQLAPLAKANDRRFGHIKGEPVRFIVGHNSRGPLNPSAKSVKEKLWDRIDAEGVCWLWVGPLCNDGYGRAAGSDSKLRLAHRVVWEELVGKIPPELEVDHLCRVRHCVNPDHLEPVTHAENMARSAVATVNAARGRQTTHCKRGHEFTEENTRKDTKRNKRYCKACEKIRDTVAMECELCGATYKHKSSYYTHRRKCPMP